MPLLTNHAAGLSGRRRVHCRPLAGMCRMCTRCPETTVRLLKRSSCHRETHLARSAVYSNIATVRSLRRSVLSAVVAACFALSAFSWGSMPGCAAPASTPAAHGGHEHGGQHDHSGRAGTLPGTNQCSVHLCCLQVAGPTPETSARARLSNPARAPGLVAANLFVPLRPSHSLPFAHAPPSTPA